MKDALIKSIQKWQDIVDGKNTDGPYSTNCPLCEVFYGDYCNGCPVMEKTGREFCRDTPYDDAWNAWCNRESDPEKYIEAANEELDFLKSLLTDLEK